MAGGGPKRDRAPLNRAPSSTSRSRQGSLVEPVCSKIRRNSHETHPLAARPHRQPWLEFGRARRSGASKSNELSHDGISGAPRVPSHRGSKRLISATISTVSRRTVPCSYGQRRTTKLRAEKTTHQQVRIDLNAKQAITFFADHLGSNLSLECSADAKSLSVRQTSISLTQ